MRTRSHVVRFETARCVLFSLVACTLMIVAWAGLAAALVPIDDFEAGGFFLQGTSGISQTITIPSYESHAIWSERRVILEPNGFEASAWLFDGTSLDDKVRYTASGGAGSLRMYYGWGFPMDLTYGGTVDTILVDLRQVIVGGWVQIGIFDGNTTGIAAATPVGPGVLAFPLADFAAANLTEARSIAISFGAGGNEGVFEIADICFWRTGASGVTYAGDWVAVQTPPIPTPPLSFRALGDLRAQFYRADIAIADARTPAGAIPSMSAVWQAVPSLGGDMAGMIFSWDPTAPFENTSFKLSMDLSPANGLVPELAHPPDPIIGDKSFLLPCSVVYRDAGGSLVGDSEIRAVFTMRGGQPLKFENVAVTPAPSKQAGLDGFILSFDLSATGNVNEGAPLFDIAWVSDWAQTATTGVAGAEGALPASNRVTLAARPSVTRGATEIHASAPLTTLSAVTIHDASGRLVRTLSLPRGATSVAWDGRDARGAELASAVYYARIEDAPARDGTRIVLVR